VDSFDYDLDLNFLRKESPKTTNEAKVEQNGSAVRNVSQTKHDSNSVAFHDDDKANTDTPAAAETLAVSQNISVPLVDRRTKPATQPAKLNNANNSSSTSGGKTGGSISRLQNQLNDNSSPVNDAASVKMADSTAVNPANVTAGPVPAIDRTKKPKGRKRISNSEAAVQQVAAEKDRLERELVDLASVQAKKALEAQQLADLMRKKKKLEEELARLTQRRYVYVQCQRGDCVHEIDFHFQLLCVGLIHLSQY
jgi:hypothetical protein